MWLLFLPLLLNVKAVSNPQVVLETSMGKIVVELYPQKAPKTVENFLRYVKEGFYDQTQFHRIIPGFVIQGGGFDLKGVQKPTHKPIINESKNGLSNERGTIAMARTQDPHSATSQFYINVKDNTFLDAQKDKWGYAVFGKVITGMEVVDAISKVKTTIKYGMKDVPETPVVLKKAYIKKAK